MYRMTTLSDDTKVGVTGNGDLKIEVRNGTGEIDEIYLPSADLERLFTFLRKLL